MLQYMSLTGSNYLFLLQKLKKMPPELDYQTVINLLKNESHPRRCLSQLVKKEILIRIKKGTYAVAKSFSDSEYSKEILSNLIYGPSYLSLEFALSYYQLIPEQVSTMTNVTLAKTKKFRTPVGHFSYDHLSKKTYPLGVCLKKTFDDRSFLIASPEKALLDYFDSRFDNKIKPKKTDIEIALTEDLRIDLSELKIIIDPDFLKKVKPIYKNRDWCWQLINYLLKDIK
jgi:hypothetical protein